MNFFKILIGIFILVFQISTYAKSITELQDEVNTLTKAITDINHTNDVISTFNNANNLCFSGKDAFLVPLMKKISNEITEIQPKVFKDDFETPISAAEHYRQLIRPFNRISLLLSHFITEIEKCRIGFSYIQYELKERRPSTSETENDLLKIQEIKDYTQDALGTLTGYHAFAKHHYDFFISGFISESQKKAAAKSLSKFKSDLYEALLNGILNYDELVAIIDESFRIRIQINQLISDLDFARKNNHLIYVQDHLPELRTHIQSAKLILGKIPQKERQLLTAVFLSDFIDSADSSYSDFEDLLKKVAPQSLFNTVKYYTSRDVEGLKIRLREDKLIPSYVTDKLNIIQGQIDQIKEKNQLLRKYAELHFAALNIQRTHIF